MKYLKKLKNYFLLIVLIAAILTGIYLLRDVIALILVVIFFFGLIYSENISAFITHRQVERRQTEENAQREQEMLTSCLKELLFDWRLDILRNIYDIPVPSTVESIELTTSKYNGLEVFHYHFRGNEEANLEEMCYMFNMKFLAIQTEDAGGELPEPHFCVWKIKKRSMIYPNHMQADIILDSGKPQPGQLPDPKKTASVFDFDFEDDLIL